MKRTLSVIAMLLLTAGFAALFAQQADESAYKPLQLYNGPWTVNMHDPASGKTATDSLINLCSRVGNYYVCQQTVNGKVAALVVFVPSGAPGHYYIQNVLPEGQATSRSDLTIDESHSVYSSSEDDHGTTIQYRTTNDFSGTDRIHFESSRSSDGKIWTITQSGDEVHSAAKP